MQGQLRNEWISVEIETSCKHCGQSLHITLDSAMQSAVREKGAAPLVFMPEVDWQHFGGRSIIDFY